MCFSLQMYDEQTWLICLLFDTFVFIYYLGYVL